MLYEYGRIQKLHDSLVKHHVAEATIREIMVGGEKITKQTKPVVKAQWLQEAMDRMDNLLSVVERKVIREGCACCLGGERFKKSKSIFISNHSLEARVDALNQTKLVIGHSAILQKDGSIIVSFQPENWEKYRCACIPQAQGGVSLTYCACCGGHVKHHVQTATGLTLQCEVISSALQSEGKSPCRFRLQEES